MIRSSITDVRHIVDSSQFLYLKNVNMPTSYSIVKITSKSQWCQTFKTIPGIE